MLGELKRRNVLRAAAAYLALAWLLVQVADTVLPLFGFADQAVRVVFVVLAIGFLPAMIAAWSFELTPEGLRRDRDVLPGSALEARTNRLLDRLIMLLLAVGLAYFAIDKFVMDPARDAKRLTDAREEGRSAARIESYGDRSIVVLPFVNMSSDAEQAYLADGLAEELLNLLAKIPELRVISRTSAFSYKERNLKSSEIADELDVVHVLEGSVRKSGNRLRITAQLIDARSDTHLWSETFDRPLDDVFAIQDEIAEAVVRQLQPTLVGKAPTAKRVDPQAYLAWMQARQIYLSASPDWAAMNRLLQTALAIEPDYADALITKSTLFWVHRHVNHDEFLAGFSPEEADRRSREALSRALELEPDNPSGLAWMGARKAYAERDYDAAARLHARALELDPSNPDALRLGAIFATLLRREELMLRLGERTVETDPMCTLCVTLLVDSYLQLGRFDEADRLLRPAVAADPEAFLYKRGLIKQFQGDPAAALQLYERDSSPPGAFAYQHRAMALHDLGRRQESADEVKLLMQRTQVGNHALKMAQVYAWIGERELAVDWAEKQLERVQTHGYPFYWVIADPILRSKLEGFPRWEGLERQYGATREQTDLIEFDPVLPESRLKGERRPVHTN